MDGNSQVNGHHPFWKAVVLTKEGKNRSAQWVELPAAFLTVMEALNNCRSLCVWVFTNLCVVTNDLAIHSGERTMETWMIKGMPARSMDLWKIEGCIKVE